MKYVTNNSGGRTLDEGQIKAHYTMSKAGINTLPGIHALSHFHTVPRHWLLFLTLNFQGAKKWMQRQQNKSMRRERSTAPVPH